MATFQANQSRLVIPLIVRGDWRHITGCTDALNDANQGIQSPDLLHFLSINWLQRQEALPLYAGSQTTHKGKDCQNPQRSVGRVFISLPQATEPIGRQI